MFYPKINSLFKREGCGTFNAELNRYECDIDHKPRKSLLILGDYACPEFETINRWQVDEKVDGTNIRIIWEPENPFSPSYGGRTDNAQLPSHLLVHLQETFTREKLFKQFPDVKKVVLFGEGYGPKIQACGSRYRDDPSFILFDVWIDGWWIQKDNVLEIADQLDIEHTVVVNNIMPTAEVIDFVKMHPKSYVAQDSSLVMEGIIARAYPLMLFRNHKTPIMFKLKVKDFEDIEISNNAQAA